jgi:predicted 2-oxoglutarate/Fe(II)-dependent dioxygenase YbiX
VPDAAFFKRFGLYVDENFLSAAECATLRAEMRASRLRRAGVYVVGSGPTYDDEKRRTNLAAVTPSSAELIDRRWTSIRPSLEQHFDLNLTGHRDPQFLLYGAGDFFVPHRDVQRGSKIPGSNKLAAVAFLNDNQSAEDKVGPASFRGGALAFYGLIPQAGGEGVGFPLVATTGLLIVFPADLTHEVREIVGGERYTVTTFFH